MTDERQNMPSASSWARYTACNGSWLLEQEAKRLGQVAHQYSSKDSERGDRIHLFQAGINTELLSEEEFEAATTLKSRAEEQKRRLFGDQPYTNLKEKRLWLDDKETVSGTKLNLSCRFDDCSYNSELCVIQDFKTGWMEPEPVAINGQMRVNVMLVAYNLFKIGVTPKKFVAQLVTLPFGVLEATWHWHELSKLYADILGTLDKLADPRAPLKPSPGACKRCPAILICSAVKDTLKPTLVTLKASPIGRDPDRLAESLDAIKIIETYITEFETFVKVEMQKEESPLKVTGYAMVPGAETRNFTNLEVAQQRLKYVADSEFFDKKLGKLKTHTVASYEKLFASYYQKKPEEVRDAFYQLMDGCIEIDRKKPSLKRVKGEPLLTEAV